MLHHCYFLSPSQVPDSAMGLDFWVVLEIRMCLLLAGYCPPSFQGCNDHDTLRPIAIDGSVGGMPSFALHGA